MVLSGFFDAVLVLSVRLTRLLAAPVIQGLLGIKKPNLVDLDWV